MCKCGEHQKELEELRDEISGKDRQIEALSLELRLALQMVEMMRHRMFGRSSEQINPAQGTFDKLLAEYDQLNGELQGTNLSSIHDFKIT